jgi:hypothetical protein
MKEIKPTYITFEQAKFLKEKGFDFPCSKAYIIYESEDTEPYNEDGLELNWNKHKSEIDYTRKFMSRPEQHVVVEWLRINHGIWVSVRKSWQGGVFIGYESQIDCEEGYFNCDTFNSPQEEYSAAFDCLLNNNLI